MTLSPEDPCACTAFFNKIFTTVGINARSRSSLFGWVTGSGLAAPAVSGAAALVLQQNPHMQGKPALVKARLLQGAVPITSLDTDQAANDYGRGFLNVAKALKL
jgi:subtilisin family serine protease